MSPWTYLAIVDSVAIVGGVYLVTTDHPWWAAVCFLLAATTTIKQRKEPQPAAKGG